MYITAHRVTRDTSDHTNAFIHVHGSDFPWPTDASGLPETDPGQNLETLRHIELPPGGNRVRSYLDVLAPDDTAWSVLDNALHALAQDIDQRLNPAIFKYGPVTVRFGVDFGLTPSRRAELTRLHGYVSTRWHAWNTRAVAA